MVHRILRAVPLTFPSWQASLLLGVGLAVAQWLFLHYGLNFEAMRSDVLEYWEDSLKWREPYNPFHVPGYSLAIAVVRVPLDSVLQPVEIMLLTTLAAFGIAITAVYRIAGTFSSTDAGAPGTLATVLFVLWPFIGTTYVSYPVADMFGVAAFVVGWLLLRRNQTVTGGVCLGLALVSHKAMWPFVGFLVLAHGLSTRSIYSWSAGAVAILPLAVLWALGASYHDSFTWILSSNVGAELGSSGPIPILDGLRSVLSPSGVAELTKSVTVLGITGASILVGILAWRLPSDNPAKWYMLVVPAAVLVLMVVLNEHEIWASVRFSRLLAIPLVWLSGNAILAAINRSDLLRYSSITVVALLLGSQFAFAYYMAEGFFV